MNREYIHRLTQLLQREGLDALLVAPSPELALLVGHSPLHCYRFQGLFLTAQGGLFYVCNLLTAGEMRRALPENTVYAWHDNGSYLDIVRQALAENGLLGKKIGVNKHVRAVHILEISQAMDVRFVSAGELCSESRIHKSQQELDHMRRAAQISEEAFRRTVAELRPGMTEQDVGETLIRHTLELGGEAPAAMVAAGPNGGDAHYTGNSRVLQKGDGVTIDFGCAWKGLRTDITRTIFLDHVSPRQRELYELVRAANEAAEALLRSGERWIPNLDAAARGVIEAAGYGPYFTTRLGHGIGYMGHEAPDIKASNTRMLEPGMCFSIEPGIYIDGELGVRIEDCAAVGLDGQGIVLTSGLPKDIQVIPF